LAGSRSGKLGECALCKRKTALTFHHLIPRKLHRRNFYRRKYTREELNRGVEICRFCHNGVHALYDESVLAKYFNSLEALQADEALQKHVGWVAKQKREVQNG